MAVNYVKGNYTYVNKVCLFLCIIFFSTSINSFASDGQTSNGRLFTAFGISMFTQYESSPVSITTNAVATTNNYTGYTTYSNVNSYIYFNTLTIESCTYSVRYNVVEMNNNMSISVAAAPCIGLSVGWATDGLSPAYSTNTDEMTPGFISLSLPFFAEFNYGNVSTFNADKESGFVFGVGYEIVKSPLILPSLPVSSEYQTNGYANPSQPAMNTNSFWTEPAFELGYRYWNKNNHAREINLKYGTGASTTFINENGVSQTIHPWTIKLTFLIYLNY
jgi:hypothetical protein